MMTRTRYVLGLMFNSQQDLVALIRKDEPAWQKGYLNGIGGKIQGEELPREAMVREFQEETGMATRPAQWLEFLWMHGPTGDGGEFEVRCFCTVGRLEDLKTMDPKEPVEVMAVETVGVNRRRMIGNLPWILFLGLDQLNDTNLQAVEAAYV